MIKILMICPGGQNNLESPSEKLAIFINKNYDDINIDIYNQRFNPINDNIDFSGYDLIWGDMDGGNVPTITITIAEKYNIPSYIHGEWIPPYRFENGWEEYFNEKTDLTRKDYYINNINAMSKANLVSLGVGYDTPGGYNWIYKKTGVKLNNFFIRYPSSKEYDLLPTPKKYQVATIARVNDGKKRVKYNVLALEKMVNPPIYKVIGGQVFSDKITILSLGAFDTDEKVKVYSESMLGLQHWSGIPPAEAIQQLCPIITFDIPLMRELYGDALIYVKKDDVDELKKTIEYWLNNHKEREDFAIKTRENYLNNKYNSQLEKHTAKLVVNQIKNIC